MQVSCKKCGNIEKGLSKSQAYDLARFEGCGKCGSNTLAVSSGDDAYDIARDKAMIAELESDHESWVPLWARW